MVETVFAKRLQPVCLSLLPGGVKICVFSRGPFRNNIFNITAFTLRSCPLNGILDVFFNWLLVETNSGENFFFAFCHLI